MRFMHRLGISPKAADGHPPSHNHRSPRKHTP
jgi:hypothetical protein